MEGGAIEAATTEHGLVERDADLAHLLSLAKTAGSGPGALALIEGPPGIGKTALLSAAARRIRADGGTILSARGTELEGEFAFGVVRQLLESEVADRAPAERGRLFSGAAALAEPLFGGAGPSPEAGPPGDVFPLIHGLYWLLAGLSTERQYLLAIDDAHWADTTSLQWMGYLARRIEDLPLLIVLTSRSTQPEAPVEAIEAMRGEPSTTTLRLTPLSEGAAAAVLGEVFGEEPEQEFTAASHEASGGNPFLLTELGRTLASEGIDPTASAASQVRHGRPAEVARSTLVRLARLPDAARDLARAAAVMGDGGAPRDVASLAELDEAAAAEAADRLTAAGFFGEGAPIRFAHPLIRSAVYDDIAPARRDLQHRKAASVLVKAAAPLEHVAAHLLLTAPAGDADVVARLRRAAADSFARGALGPAIELLRRAVAEPPPAAMLPEILLGLGRAESAAFDPDAPTHLLEAFRLARDPDTRADAAEASTIPLLFAGRTAEARETLEAVIAEQAERDPDRALQIESQFISAAMIDPDATGLASERLDRVGEDLPGDSMGERMMLCYLAYRRMWTSRDAGRAVQLAEGAAGDGRLLSERGIQPHDLNGVVMPLICAHRLDAAAEFLDQIDPLVRSTGSGIGFAWAAAMRSELALRRGDLSEVDAQSGASLEITLETGILLGAAVDASRLIRARIEREELDRAEELLRRMGFSDAPIPPPLPFSFLLAARGRLRLAQGDVDAALADLLECRRRCQHFGMRNSDFIAWRVDAALAHRAVGDDQAARALADEELEAANDWGTPAAIGIAERLNALLASDPDTAITGLRRAVEALERSPAQLEHARALADLGAALRRAKQRADSREPLRKAIDIAQRLGASEIARRATEELKATGARPRRLVLSGPESLTASERRVAQLAADGLSNPEIAQSLFVTRKTVETHLGAVYRKLEIGSRSELPEALGRT